MRRSPFRHTGLPLALALVAGLALGACGTGGAVVRPAAPPPEPISVPDPEPVAVPEPPAPTPAPPPPPARVAAPPGTVVQQSWYPASRLDDWTLATGGRVVYRRVDEAPNVVVRARAPGGWLAAPPSLRAAAARAAAPTRIARGGAVVTIRLAPAATIVEGEAPRAALPDLFEALGEALGAPVRSGDPAPDRDADAALDAALAGVDPRPLAAGASSPGDADEVHRLFFARPGAFTVAASGAARSDSVEWAVGRALGRLRLPSGVRPYGDSLRLSAAGVPVPSRGVEIALPADGGAARALVGFRARLPETLAGRTPADVRAGLEVLAALVAREAARALPDAEVDARVELDGRVATLVLDASGGRGGGEALRDALLRAAGAVAEGPSEADVTPARGAAAQAVERRRETPSGWLGDVEAFAREGDPRAPVLLPQRVRAVTVERVRALARALLAVERAAAVVQG